MTDDYARGVAETLIGQLREGTAPWQRPWRPGERFLPYNPTTGNDYHGMNAMWLLAVGTAQHYSDCRWMTYRQAQDAGAQVRKGERGTTIVYWKWQGEERVRDEQGRPVRDEAGRSVTQLVQYQRPRVFSAAVFNAEQIDGLPPDVGRPAMAEWERHERAEAILTNSRAALRHVAGDRAYYDLAADQITLPERSQFPTADGYYATALHELGHWTGHPSRLARDLAHPFGSDGYAREELRAEIASLMLGAQLGIGYDPGKHAAYVGSWIAALQHDPREVFRAAADAEKMATHVRGFEQRQEHERAVPSVVAAVAALTGTAEQAPALARDAEMARPGVGVADAIPLVAAPIRPPVLVHDSRASEVTMQARQERVYLAVPYAEKDDAKALGAKWDRAAKSWFAPPGADLAALERWVPGRVAVHLAAYADGDPRAEFAEALREAGLRMEELPVMDGHLHRVAVDGDRAGERSGGYVGFLDGHPAGYINNYRTGLSRNWKSQQPVASLGALDRARLAAEAAERDQAREKVRARQHHATVAAIEHYWTAAPPAPAEHPYLQAKGVQPHGLRVAEGAPLTLPPSDPDAQRWGGPGHLLVPVRDADGTLLGAQSIDAEGRKSFPRGGRVHGGHHLLGDLAAPGPLLIAEGYATAATLHEETGAPVAIAFNAGNLEPVARAFRARYPDRPIYIAADNDHRKARELGPDGRPKPNVGLEKAAAAAVAVGGAVLAPQFAPEERGTDWNDLRRSKGPEEFARQLSAALAVAERHTLAAAQAGEHRASVHTLATDAEPARVQQREARTAPERESAYQVRRARGGVTR